MQALTLSNFPVDGDGDTLFDLLPVFLDTGVVAVALLPPTLSLPVGCEEAFAAMEDWEDSTLSSVSSPEKVGSSCKRLL